MQPGARKTYVLDTSVLLSDPRRSVRFDEHEVVVPVVVVTELEGKAHPSRTRVFRARRCGCSMSCASAMVDSMSPRRSAMPVARCVSS